MRPFDPFISSSNTFPSSSSATHVSAVYHAMLSAHHLGRAAAASAAFVALCTLHRLPAAMLSIVCFSADASKHQCMHYAMLHSKAHTCKKGYVLLVVAQPCSYPLEGFQATSLVQLWHAAAATDSTACCCRCMLQQKQHAAYMPLS